MRAEFEAHLAAATAAARAEGFEEAGRKLAADAGAARRSLMEAHAMVCESRLLGFSL